jgi:hypothetical protein
MIVVKIVADIGVNLNHLGSVGLSQHPSLLPLEEVLAAERFPPATEEAEALGAHQVVGRVILLPVMEQLARLGVSQGADVAAADAEADIAK